MLRCRIFQNQSDKIKWECTLADSKKIHVMFNNDAKI